MDFDKSYPHSELTRQIIGCAIEVHDAFGPGLLENAYRACLCRELALRNLAFESEVRIPLIYKGTPIDFGYRADLIVKEAVIVELKTVERFLAIHDAQLLTYLKLCRLDVGLLINFNTTSLRKGVRRLVLSH